MVVLFRVINVWLVILCCIHVVTCLNYWTKAECVFAEATPSDDEKALHDTVAEVLNKAPVILDRLRKYAGCEEYIRKVCGPCKLLFVLQPLIILQAITTPGPETEDAAWEAVLPAVDQLQQFYDFSLELGIILYIYLPYCVFVNELHRAMFPKTVGGFV